MGGTLALEAAAARRSALRDLTRGENGGRGTPETRAAEAVEAARILGVAHRELGLPGPASMYERAAVAQHHVEIVVPAEGMVPGQPVDEHLRPALDERPHQRALLLVHREHALGVDHALRAPGRARCEQDLRDGVGSDPGEGFAHFQPRTPPGGARRAASGSADRVEGRCEPLRVGRPDQAGRSSSKIALSLAKSFDMSEYAGEIGATGTPTCIAARASSA